MTFFDTVNLHIGKAKEAYGILPINALKDFNSENELADEYHGRQILELLQNADDASATEVLIEWEKSQKRISIKNNGDPFTPEGLIALMVGNVSTKPRSLFIGNKGLGFRSILKWASEIHINTHGHKVIFSEKRAEENFNLCIKEVDRTILLENQNQNQSSVPFPRMAIPKIETNKSIDNSWVTAIEIYYLPVMEESISEQLKEFKTESLLFINHIISLEIKGSDEINQKININRTPKVNIENDLFTRQIDSAAKKWSVLGIEKDLPDYLQTLKGNKKEKCSIGIAYQDDLSDTYNKLFTFFPTKEPLHLPCIVHASFDLSSNRNELNQSKKNIYILEQLVELLAKIAILIKKDNPDWQSYQILTPSAVSSNEDLKTLFEGLKNKKNELKIFPCVDGEYRTSKNLKHYSNDFAKWILDNNKYSFFRELIKPIPKGIIPEIDLSACVFNKNEFIKRINLLSETKLSIESRADLINFLTENPFPQGDEVKYAILLEEEGHIIPIGTKVFTIATKGKTFPVPKFIKIRTLNSELYIALIKKFQLKTSNSRLLEDYLEKICDISSYEPYTIWENLLSNVQKYFEKDSNKGNEEYLEWIRTLFNIWKNFGDTLKQNSKWSEIAIEGKGIPLLNRNGKLKFSNELLLGKHYSSGALAEEIYSSAINKEYYLPSKEKLGLIEHNYDEIESFLLWTGVNKSFRIAKKNRRREGEIEEYINYSIKLLSPSLQSYQSYITNIQSYELVDFEIINSLCIEDQFKLMCKDDFIKTQLSKSNNDIISYSYYGVNRLIGVRSFISYQFNAFGKFKNLIISDYGDELNKFINQGELFDYKKYDDENSENAKDLLVELGANSTFDKISPQRIYQLLKSIRNDNDAGKLTQSFYGLALNYLDKLNPEYLPTEEDLNDLLVFAKMGDEAKWLKPDEVYYSNDTILPASIIKTKFILNVPKRFGEDKVSKYLGVNLFKDFKLEMVVGSIRAHSKQNELRKEMDKLHPYILGYRIKDLDNTKPAFIANQLKRYKINLIESGKYKVNNDEEIDLLPNEFINEGKEFYLCAEESSISILKSREPNFSNSIAEILCIVLKTWGHQLEFRNAFKFGIEEVEFLFTTRGEDQFLVDARSLLGISQSELLFWKSIYKIKNIPFLNEIKGESELKEKINSDLNIILDDNYNKVDLSNFDTPASFDFLKDLCTRFSTITLKKIKECNTNFSGLIKWHYSCILKEGEKIQKRFEYALWSSFCEKDITIQKSFLAKINRYNQFITKNEWRKIDAFDFDCDYCKIIQDALEKEFEISFNINFSKDLAIKNLYTELFKKFGVEFLSISAAEQSLCHFPKHDELIIKMLQEMKPETNSIDDIPEVNVDDLKVKSGSLIEVSGPEPFVPPDDSLLPSVHSDAREKGKKKAGKKAEINVVTWLRTKYHRENVTWISGYTDEPGKNDKAGYDVKYRLTPESDYIYVEVKSFSGSSFIISSNEISKGLKEKEKYHIALVHEEEIYFVEDYFIGEQRRTEFERLTSIGSIRPMDYEIYFKIPEFVPNKKAVKS